MRIWVIWLAWVKGNGVLQPDGSRVKLVKVRYGCTWLSVTLWITVIGTADAGAVNASIEQTDNAASAPRDTFNMVDLSPGEGIVDGRQHYGPGAPSWVSVRIRSLMRRDT